MKLKDIKQIWEWIDEGNSLQKIAEFTYINPDIIDMVAELKKAKVNLELYA